MFPMATLTNRVALVTGSTSGIGKGIAEHFASLGAQVMVHGREADAGARIVGEMTERGGRAAFHRGDLADEDACRGLVRETVARFGGIDILVNNAASTARGDLASASVAFWDRMMAVNLRAPFILMQEALPTMTARGGGSIINIGSINAYVGQHNLFAYSVSKGGLMTLTKNAALGLAAQGIRVNQLNVGWTLTEGEQRVKTVDEGLGPDWLDAAVATRPFGRLLLPQDIANAAAYFASDASALITGSVLDLEQFPVGAPGTW
jgi:NAD(P)-dependent dehydrogenase (short-subunit alcohol dehydrogenase family)